MGAQPAAQCLVRRRFQPAWKHNSSMYFISHSLPQQRTEKNPPQDVENAASGSDVAVTTATQGGPR